MKYDENRWQRLKTSLNGRFSSFENPINKMVLQFWSLLAVSVAVPVHDHHTIPRGLLKYRSLSFHSNTYIIKAYVNKKLSQQNGAI